MTFPQPEIIGNSPAIKKVIEITRKVSAVDLTVLIMGESGVGKELVARSLHYYSPRCPKPFVKVNSAALPSELIESELFGYDKGAFTGAESTKIGKFELAKDGSIFLDEIGELPLLMQSKLLQVLQDRTFHRVGGNTDIHVKARVIAATNQNLDSQIISGKFRDDLYYRLSTISIYIPPLRERKEDIQPLIDYFLQKFHNELGLPRIKISPRLMDIFFHYHWPGNVRELENYLKRLCVLGNEDELANELTNGKYHTQEQELDSNNAGEQDKTAHSLQGIDNDIPLPNHFPSLKEIKDQAVRKIERKVIKKVLEQNQWNRKKTSEILQISYRALLYKIKELEIVPPNKNKTQQRPN